MAIELYLMPMAISTDPESLPTVRHGKYTHTDGVTKSGCIRYGRTDDAIVLIQAAQTVLDTISANADVTLLATQSNIDVVLKNNQANTAKTIFEAAFIPNIFINAGDTRREVLRAVIGSFLFSQRMEGLFGESWKRKAQAAGVTLGTQWQDFPQALKDALIAVRDDFGWSNLGITNTSTLREILKEISGQFSTMPFFIAGFEI